MELRAEVPKRTLFLVRQFSGLDRESSPGVEALQCARIGVPEGKKKCSRLPLEKCYFLSNNFLKIFWQQVILKKKKPKSA